MAQKQIKFCYGCGNEKPLKDFHKNKRTKDGYSNRCKVCVKDYAAENKAEINKRAREYWKIPKNRERKKQAAKKW